MKNGATLNDAVLEKFKTDFSGQIILPQDPEFNDARKVWNGYFDKHPIAVARCQDPGDVVAAVNLARKLDVPLAVRGGGHDYAGNSVCNQGLVIDLSPMKLIQINSSHNTALVQAGATCGEFDAMAQKFGLATTLGTASSIGVSGLTLGGGTGYLSRKYGMAIDNLLSVEMVTADGELVTASEKENEDLFWAVRGGGGNFGVVTAFVFQLHEVGPEVLLSQAFFPLEDCRMVLESYRRFMETAPDEVQSYCFILHTPPVDPFPAEYHGKAVCALITCYAGDLEKGKLAIRPVENIGQPFYKTTQLIPYLDLQKSFDAGMPKGLRWYSKAQYISELGDSVIDTLEKFTDPLPGPYTMVYFEPQGGAINRISPHATAFPHRKAGYSLHTLAGWADETEDEGIIKWAKSFHRELAKDSTGGVYVNLLSHDEKERVKEAYGENYDRLVEIKRKWDPNNLFGQNHNIRPSH